MKEELKNRTKKFCVEIIKFSDLLPQGNKSWIIQKQIIRSSTSVAANYRAVCRAKSDADFINKMGIVIEEADETLFWLELIEELQLSPENSQIQYLMKESNELTSIFVASIKTVKKRLNLIK